MRKFWFAYLAKALVIFPGGFGTCDELFEILTLAQTDKLSKKIGVILYGREYLGPGAQLRADGRVGCDRREGSRAPAICRHARGGVRAASGAPDRASPGTQERAGSRRAGDCEDPRLKSWDTTTRKTLTDQYKDGYRQVRGRARGRVGCGARCASAPGKWSAREIVHHLADSEMTSAIRLRRLLAEDKPVINGYDEAECARRLHYDRPIEGSARGVQDLAIDHRRDPRSDDGSRVAAGGHAQRERTLFGRTLARNLRGARAQARRPNPPRQSLIEKTLVQQELLPDLVERCDRGGPRARDLV